MSPNKETADSGKENRPTETKSKKPYAKPHLTIYGSIEKLTKTGGQTVRDGKSTSKSHF